jgi:hypothetical protein
MNVYEHEMVRRYARTNGGGGALFLEFPLVRRSAESSPRWLGQGPTG